MGAVLARSRVLRPGFDSRCISYLQLFTVMAVVTVNVCVLMIYWCGERRAHLQDDARSPCAPAPVCSAPVDGEIYS